ncbi:hypothetical protein M407DRAFT_227054 [Tulasnella calospora MUT 4182]|uniref:Integrase core domain-containing protein n=1 Tax=Tulasnella calospora MUT 4182 TaxID=1051891 RepID=A0A0C3QXS9_9AGAM|nr:hypothetical protein M407DRAFT_227054 [Tulasnella calospora MUT 4182]
MNPARPSQPKKTAKTTTSKWAITAANSSEDPDSTSGGESESKNLFYNRNPDGNNQHDGGLPNTREVRLWLQRWAAKGVHNRKMLKDLALAELGYKCSESTIGRARMHWGIKASGATLKCLGIKEAKKIIKDAMDKNPSRSHGLRGTCDAILADNGFSLPQQFVRKTMKEFDPEGFELRKPGAKIIHRGVLTAAGLHEEWSGDGHDGIGKYGLYIWGVRDKWSRAWLGVRVVPNNRLQEIVAYVWLGIVYEVGGVPVQMTTDCGSENPVIYGLTNALREEYAPGLNSTETPAHRFLKSVHNITIERGWHSLKMAVLKDIKNLYEDDDECINPANPKHFLLARHIWSVAVQKRLDEARDQLNNHKSRRDKTQALQSGVSPAVLMALPKQYGADNFLIEVDRKVVKEMMDELGGEDLVRFVTRGYEEKVKTIQAELGLGEFTVYNAWDSFTAILPFMPAPEPDELAFAGIQ